MRLPRKFNSRLVRKKIQFRLERAERKGKKEKGRATKCLVFLVADGAEDLAEEEDESAVVAEGACC